ncbi:MAG: SDR family NAD(P)-dependent oxidoreductase [Anaerolineaceae bacterium]|nr:SDR family NAD(P)-dependent oxidoreductase [Anaerolineaceae bacterium]
MATYLVTGAAGFIAYRVCELLLDEGHQVVGVDNLCDDYDVRIKEWRLNQLLKRKTFQFFQQDIADFEALQAVFAGQEYDAVFNLAARAGVRASVEDPWSFVNTNMTGTLNLLEMCHRKQIRKFILASTSSVYGEDAPLPTPETAESNLVLQPYAASKKGAEAMCHAYHFLYDIDVTIFRYFTVYGPAGRPNMAMLRFVQWIAEGRPLTLFGDGKQTRGFTYLDDIARGTIMGLKPVGFEVINLGGHEVITINALIALIEEKLGKKAIIERMPAHKADMRSNHADVAKARKLLGWEAQVELDEGVQRAVDWYLAERDWASQVITR